MGSYLNFKSFAETPQNQATGLKPPASIPLIRQSSVYSLTFDEFQNTLNGSGKDFGSMNMDELLKNIWTAEETQAMATPSKVVGQGSDNNNNNNIPSGNLNRQGSLTLPRTISQKTVDEVWKELYNPTLGPNLQQQQKQPTLREITLEEFLFKAGVVREDALQNSGLYSGVTSQLNNNNLGLSIGFQQSAQNNIGTSSRILDNNSIVPNQPSSLPVNSNNNIGLSIGFQQSAQNNKGMNNRILNNNTLVHNQPSNLPMNMSGIRPSQQQMPQPLFPKQANVTFASSMPNTNNTQLASPSINNGLFQGGPLAKIGAAMGSPASHLSPNVAERSNGDTSSMSPSPYMFNGGARGRKSGTLEKSMERRHRRMIKNRESAARSRSRKQAYTLELEAEVEKLKEMNNELRKKQDELMDMQTNQVSEATKTSWGSKRRCLRRTLTGPW